MNLLLGDAWNRNEQLFLNDVEVQRLTGCLPDNDAQGHVQLINFESAGQARLRQRGVNPIFVRA